MDKTRELEMRSSIIGNLLIISEERHYHVCCILVVRMTNTGRNVGRCECQEVWLLGSHFRH